MQVKMKDGFIVDAPDGSSKQDVLSLYAQQKPQEISSIPNEVAGLNYAKGLGRSTLEGATLGFADEIGLGVAALPASLMAGNPYGEVYGDMRKTYNQQQQEFERQNPKTAIAANIAGGLMTGSVIGGKLLGTAAGMAKPIKTATQVGMGTGLVSGIGYAPTKEDIPLYAGAGLAAGGILPPALMFGGKSVGAAFQPIKSFFSSSSPTSIAGKVIAENIKRDAIPFDTLKKMVSKKGDKAGLADVAGLNFQGMAGAAAQQAGKTKDSLGKMFMERQSGSFSRLIGSLKKMSGGDTNYFKNMQGIISKRREEANKLYAPALKTSIDGVEAQSIAAQARGIGQKYEPAAKFANKFFRKNSNGTLQPKMTMQELHSLQRELRDNASVAYRNGEGTLGGEITKMRDALLSSMDKVGQYKLARSTYAGSKAVESSMQLGRNILKDDFDEMANTVGKMSLAEKEGFINGALKTVRDRLMTGKGDKNAATKLSSDLVRERLRNVFPDDATYNKFISQLDIEDDFARTYQKTFGGSPTQPRQEANKQLIDDIHGTATLEGGDTITKAASFIKTITGRGDIPQGVSEEIQRLAFSPKLTAKDWKMLRKYSINKPKLEKIKLMLPTAPSSTVVGAAQSGAPR